MMNETSGNTNNIILSISKTYHTQGGLASSGSFFMNLFKLKEQIVRHEGLRLKPYQDTIGLWTIGVGRCLDTRGISRLEAMFLLSNDLRECMDDVESFAWWGGLSDKRQIALVDMRFNLGGGGFRKFEKMINAIERQDFDEAAKEMLSSRWAEQVGQRSITLAKMMLEG